MKLKTADLEDFTLKTIGVVFTMTIKKNLIIYPNTHTLGTQNMFTEIIKDSFSLTFALWATNRKTVITDVEFLLDKGSSSNIIFPKLLIVAHETEAGAKKGNNLAKSDRVVIRKYFVETDGLRYPNDCIDVEYSANDYLNQIKTPDWILKDYIGELLSDPSITYPDIKNFYPIQVIDSRLHANHTHLKKQKIFEE